MKRWLLLVSALVALNVLMIAHLGSATNEPAAWRHRTINQDTRSPVLPQEQRIREYIKRVDQEDLEALVDGLNSHEDLVARVWSRSNDLAPEMAFQACLANRRLAKLFALMQQMPPAEAEGLAIRLFEAKFAKHVEDLARIESLHRSGKTSPVRIPAFENAVALAASVFLSARFCDTEEFLRQVDVWDEFGRDLIERIESDETHLAMMRGDAEMWGGPQDLYLVNLYMSVLRERFGITPKQLAADRIIPGTLQWKTRELVSFDSAVGPYDFPHQSGGRTIATEDVLMHFDVVDFWGFRPKEFKRDVVSNLRGAIDGCLHEESAK
ncbi:hypothetical protein Mal4_24440 [Maioricimonas rarisocia]|uniref:Uncharacterized protein n=1 Tax=Maioricimonas rarisocia TaxID=2528026 RepID=A0A517Z6K1_9PLAN|nr:hypothetical protein [Maioricimonas rarisocia]QDU38122.1 hypothetical protein Mal4_24440 [Maioricimonas rarisocia]